MTPQQWQRIKEVAGAAFEMEQGRRSQFLDHQCGSDRELRRAVEALLEGDRKEGQTIEEAIAAAAAQVVRTPTRESSSLRPGQTISHYTITEKLGEGGMGVVYKAEDSKLERSVALKFLPPHVFDDEELKLRFLQEARAAAALNHPNICTIHEIDEADGRDFIVMECVEGQSIKQKIEQGAVPLDQALAIAIQMGEGLADAHERGIVHRDIKPSNVMLDRKGRVKILDFGLALVTYRTKLTKTGATLGTPAYMSPEQALGEKVDQQSDIWSLGAVLYEMVAGEPAFQGAIEAVIVYSILHVDPKPATSLRPGLPGEMDVILSRALAKTRDQRYPRIEDLLVDLRAVRESLVSAERRPFAASIAIPESAPPVRSSRPWGRAAIVALLLALVLMAGWRWRQSERLRWALAEALPEIERLEAGGARPAAFELALRAEEYLEGNPRFTEVLSRLSVLVSIETTPEGASIFYKPSTALDGGWQPLGRSPLKQVRLPSDFHHLRIEKTGFATAEQVVDLSEEGLTRMFEAEPSLQILLHSDTEVPAGMVHVPDSWVSQWTFLQSRDPEVKEFFLDRYEVTNQQFLEFVEAGGYQNREYWKHEFLKAGRTLSWAEAMAEFRDATGRPGPATWELGRFREGEHDLPVGGVSWYEAAAYAEYANKSLPTVYHWAAAIFPFHFAWVVPQSNFGEQKARPVQQSFAMSDFGSYDQLGNVKEWCWNQAEDDGSQRYLMGGGWGEPEYMVEDPELRESFHREPNFGFRCARYGKPVEPSLLQPVPLPGVDYSQQRPVADREFGVFRRLYSYDPSPLNETVEGNPEETEFWRSEIVTVDAAYGKERLPVYLLLPKNRNPPYQAVVVFPATDAWFLPTRASIHTGYTGFFTGFLAKTGRAVIYPIYSGTYGREWPWQPGTYGPEGPTKAWSDKAVRWYQDLARSMDYLETRQDIDHGRIAYFGLSLGAGEMGSIVLALEHRFRAAVLCFGGLAPFRLLPEADAFHFAPRVELPTLMINGSSDHWFALQTSQEPLYRLLGTPPAQKRHALYEAGHSVEKRAVVKETLDWLDQYLGPVQ